MNYGKKIAFAVSVLFAVMILCVWKSTGSIVSGKNAHSKTEFVEFDLKKRGNDLALSGVFASKEDMEKLLLSAALDESVKIDKINYDKRRKINEVAGILKDIMPAFMSDFKNGRVGYHDGQLVVSGEVESDENRRAMESLLKSSGVPYYIQIEVKGLSDKYNEGIDRASYSPEEKEVVRDIGEVLKLKTVEFQMGSAKLTAAGMEVVDKIAMILKAHENVRIKIAGHTDNTGDPASNMKLSKARVRSVKARLVSRGINSDRMETVGYGETRPIFPNTSKENRMRNRRVEFIIITSKGE